MREDEKKILRVRGEGLNIKLMTIEQMSLDR